MTIIFLILPFGRYLGGPSARRTVRASAIRSISPHLPPEAFREAFFDNCRIIFGKSGKCWKLFFVTSTGLAPSQDLALIERAEIPTFPGKMRLHISCNVQGGFKIATIILLLFPRLYICILCISAPSASVSIGQRHDSAKCNIREVLSAEKHTTIL